MKLKKNKRYLIIGSGPSGVSLAVAISAFKFFRQLFLFRKNIDLKKKSSTFIPQGLLRFYLSEDYDDKKHFFNFINSK